MRRSWISRHFFDGKPTDAAAVVFDGKPTDAAAVVFDGKPTDAAGKQSTDH